MLAALPWIVLASPAFPDASVLLLQPPDGSARPALVETVRIQLADVARVEPLPGPSGVLLGERVAEAAGQVEAKRAVLAVWIEPAATEGELLLFAVSRHRERALVQVIRIPHGSQEEIDRVVAIKVGELVDAAIAARAVLEPLRPARPTPPSGPSRIGLLLEVGAEGAVGGAGGQLGPVVLAGAALRRGALAAEAGLFWRGRSDQEATHAAGRVVVEDTGLGASLRGLWRGRWLAAGPYLEGGAHLIDARGTARDGSTGTARRIVPAWGAGLDGRLAVAGRLELRAAVGVEATLTRHRFAVDDMPVIDLGRVRPAAQVSLVISVP